MNRKSASRPSSGTIPIVVVLGSPNDARGRLSSIAVNRARAGLATYRKLRESKFLLTGGYGQHFNIAPKPHAYYVARYLRRNGVPAKDILGFVLSSNTMEDAMMVKEVVGQRGCVVLHVVTSDFHMKRAQAIFRQVLKGQRMLFVSAETDVTDEQLRQLQQHELAAMERLREKGFFSR